MAGERHVPHTVRAGATKTYKQETWEHLRSPKHQLREHFLGGTVQDELSQRKDEKELGDYSHGMLALE